MCNSYYFLRSFHNSFQLLTTPLRALLFCLRLFTRLSVTLYEFALGLQNTGAVHVYVHDCVDVVTTGNTSFYTGAKAGFRQSPSVIYAYLGAF